MLHMSIAKVDYFTSGGQTDHPLTWISGPGKLRLMLGNSILKSALLSTHHRFSTVIATETLQRLSVGRTNLTEPQDYLCECLPCSNHTLNSSLLNRHTSKSSTCFDHLITA